MTDIVDFVRDFEETLQANGLQEGIGENVDPDALALTYDNLTKRSFSLEMADAPKALADMVEALAGAVFVDSGFSLERVFEVCNDLK